MPTPAIYKRLAGRLHPKRFALWMLFTGGPILMIGGIYLCLFLYNYPPLQILPALGIAFGLMFFFGGWGLICVEFWFFEGEPPAFVKRIAARFPRMYRAWNYVWKPIGFAGEWYACLFLAVLFAMSFVLPVGFIYFFIIR